MVEISNNISLVKQVTYCSNKNKIDSSTIFINPLLGFTYRHHTRFNSDSRLVYPTNNHQSSQQITISPHQATTPLNHTTPHHPDHTTLQHTRPHHTISHHTTSHHTTLHYPHQLPLPTNHHTTSTTTSHPSPRHTHHHPTPPCTVSITVLDLTGSVLRVHL